MPQDNLRKLLLEAVEEGLSLLGDSPKKAIFFHLERSFRIKKEKIPRSLRQFVKALEKIFGPGTPYIEKLIAKRLYEKSGLTFKEIADWNFLEYVDDVKKHLATEGSA